MALYLNGLPTLKQTENSLANREIKTNSNEGLYCYVVQPLLFMYSNMWNKPWTLKEGFAIGGGLIITGLMLQLSVGPVNWDILAWPANIIVLSAYLILIGCIYLFRHKLYIFSWLSHFQAAITSLSYAAGLTLLMGITPQVVASQGNDRVPWLSQMLSFWPFVLIYIEMTTIVGLVALKRVVKFKKGNIGSIINHLGLFIALVCATLGSADMQRLEMTVRMGTPEWRAKDKMGYIHELPIAIELNEFTIDEYPPKLMLIDNETGKVLPIDKPAHILLEDDVYSGNLLKWNITIEKKIESSAEVTTNDTTNYVEWHSMGAAYAALIKAVDTETNREITGWVTCGSFLFPYRALKLDSICSLVMPDREPRRYASRVHVYTQKGEKAEGTIEVNKPMNIDNWDIYQLSYDETKGKWSDISIFELVTDPWLPAVYVGIIMMLLGAVFTFATAGRRKENER